MLVWFCIRASSATHAKASLPLYERSVGFASVPRQASVLKAFGRSFQASLPCLPLLLHQPPTLPQALRTVCQALKIIPAFNVFCALQYHTKSNQLIRKNRFCKKATAKAVAQKIIYLKPS